MQNLNKLLTKQKGAALVILAVILALAATTFLVSQLDGSGVKIEREKKTAIVLNEAKNALLGWSVLQGKPGILPCPEDATLIGSVNEGSALVSCNSAFPVVGRLPWRTLGLGDIRDGNGDRLWYAVSSGFSDVAVPINSLLPVAQINVNGTPVPMVAIIFSSGVILAGQNRPLPNAISPPAVAGYLDLTNNDGDINFSSTGAAGTFNDGLLAVTQTELFRLVERRILREVRGDTTQGLARFYIANANNYPYADLDNNGYVDAFQLAGAPSYEGINDTDPDNLFFNVTTKNILVNNNWMPLINYQISADRQVVTMTLNGQTLNMP
jgi:hypothetical protein